MKVEDPIDGEAVEAAYLRGFDEGRASGGGRSFHITRTLDGMIERLDVSICIRDPDGGGTFTTKMAYAEVSPLPGKMAELETFVRGALELATGQRGGASS